MAASLKVSHQLTLAESFKSRQTYEKSSRWQAEITKSWQYLLGVPMYHTMLLKILNFVTSWPHLTIATVLLVGHWLSKKCRRFWSSWKPGLAPSCMKQERSAFALMYDQKKGLTSSYLGIMAHFFSRKDHRRHCATLAVHAKDGVSSHRTLHQKDCGWGARWMGNSSHQSVSFTDR